MDYSFACFPIFENVVLVNSLTVCSLLWAVSDVISLTTRPRVRQHIGETGGQDVGIRTCSLISNIFPLIISCQAALLHSLSIIEHK